MNKFQFPISRRRGWPPKGMAIRGHVSGRGPAPLGRMSEANLSTTTRAAGVVTKSLVVWGCCLGLLPVECLKSDINTPVIRFV